MNFDVMQQPDVYNHVKNFFYMGRPDLSQYSWWLGGKQLRHQSTAVDSALHGRCKDKLS